MEPERYLIVASEPDPVAAAVARTYEGAPSIGEAVEGTAIRRIAPGVLLLRRPGPHLRDDHLDRKLPGSIRAANLPMVFPSIHRSAQGVRCFTAHSLGNLRPSAESGGSPGQLVPAAPRLMADALRRLDEAARTIGLRGTYEATHHGPTLGAPAFFVEVGFGDDPGPSEAATALIARVVTELTEDPRDRVAVGIGGGHYCPHFTELALERHWALGHIASDHSLADLAPGALDQAFARTPGSEGALLHRAREVRWIEGARPRLSEASAPRRERRG
ncbi:MAG TPA: D-aminoacyl-tRNA deacylase [Thermoplasmata archaeon]|nr:D-aminoacyl-tRNA deacylase [Thermoplasmata archaeon]